MLFGCFLFVKTLQATMKSFMNEFPKREGTMQDEE